jgi:hypothetical protein
MTKQILRIGPLTFGAAIGSAFGLVLALIGLASLQLGTIAEDDNSVLYVFFNAAIVGLVLGLFAEFLMSHSAVAARPFVRHILRPLTFCSLPYIVIAASLKYFGYEKLMGGFGFWFCVVIVPILGIVVACLRKFYPGFDQRYSSAAPKKIQTR